MKRSGIIGAAIVLAVVTSACGKPHADEEPASNEQANTGPLTEIALTLPDADFLRVCRGGASFRNGTDVGAIRADGPENELVRLSYTRDDGRLFTYDCMIEGDQIRYRMIDEAGPGSGPGTWSGRGSKTTFQIFPDEIEFTDDFFDGSTDTRRIEI